MRNQIFQMLWFALKGLTPRKTGNGTKYADYFVRMERQINLAKIFGGGEIALIGDSNSERATVERYMRRFDRVALSLGIGGLRPDHYVDFLKEDMRAPRLLVTLNAARTYWNIGGNAILQNMMPKALDSLRFIKSKTPNSYNCLVPPIHLGFFEAVGLDRSKLDKDIQKMNGWIRDIWGPRAIDTYTPFLDPATGEAYPGVLQDPIHYSGIIIKAIIDVENRLK